MIEAALGVPSHPQGHPMGRGGAAVLGQSRPQTRAFAQVGRAVPISNKDVRVTNWQAEAVFPPRGSGGSRTCVPCMVMPPQPTLGGGGRATGASYTPDAELWSRGHFINASSSQMKRAWTFGGDTGFAAG